MKLSRAQAEPPSPGKVGGQRMVKRIARDSSAHDSRPAGDLHHTEEVIIGIR
jgi:hypothetical protein